MCRTLGALTALFCVVSIFAQDEAEQKKPPTTKLEAFQSRTGVVLIRGYSTVGILRGMGGDISVEAREFRDGSNPNSPRATGVSITVRETGRLGRENVSYVDFDEIDSLLKGIEYISKVNREVTKLALFEVDYRTKGDLRISVFSNQKGDVSAAVSSGTIGRTSSFINLTDLGKLCEMIANAKSML